MKKHLSGVLILHDSLGHWGDTKIASTSPHGPVGPDDPTKFYNPLWCVLNLGGIGNKGSDCASWGLLPSYLAI